MQSSAPLIQLHPSLRCLSQSVRLLCAYLLSTFVAHAQDIEYATLSGLIEQGTQAFAQGHYPAAANAYGKVQTLYNEDANWQNGQLPRKLLPLTGYAALKAGFNDQSIAAFELYLEDYADNYAQKTFSEFSLALAHKQQGNTEAAINQFAQFRSNTKSPSLQAIAGIQEAALLVETGKVDTALQLLSSLCQGNRAERVKTQARLAAIHHAINAEKLNQASDLLLNHKWNTDAMPELALLSFAAIAVGDHLLASQRPTDALHAYRLVLPQETLILRQEEKLNLLKARYQERRRTLKLQTSLWDEFYRQIINTLEHQLASLKNTPDYAPALLLRRGQAYLASQRPREAWLIFERLSQNPDPQIASQAHYLWIAAAREAKLLPEAILIAKDYLAQYPDDEQTLHTLYLLGNIFVEEDQFENAIQSFDTIIDHPQTTKLTAPALFNRAFCYASLNDYPTARSDFQRIQKSYKDSPLAPNAAIWEGLTHFFENHFTQALQHFQKIQETLKHPHHQAELLYRIATTYFAQRNYPQTEKTCETYLKTHKQHERHAEVSLLLGDARTQQRNYEDAIKAYSHVSSDQTAPYHHAILETARCYLELNKAPLALQTLQTYAEKAPQDLLAQVFQLQISIYLETNQPDRAFATLSQTLDTIGNNPQATGTFHCIQSLSRHPQYENYLQTQLQHSKDLPTLSARLELAIALHLQNTNKPYQAEVILLEMASRYELKALPEECLAHVGLKLAEIYSEQSKDFLDQLTHSYPQSEYTSFIHYANALQADRKNDPLTTLAWLDHITPSDYQAPFYIDALLLKANTLQQTGEHLKSQETYQSILSLRFAKGLNKAQALFGLAQNAASQNKLEEAIIYYQRIYTLYPAYADLAANSYLQSAQLFLQINDAPSATRTCQDFLKQERFSTSELYPKIQSLLNQAQSQLPPPNES